MSLFDIFAILITLAALFSFLNYRYLKLPTTIGVMLIGLLLSVLLIVLDLIGMNVTVYAENILAKIDFNKALMHGMLSYLLFAGSLHINLENLAKQKWLICILATFGVITSTFITGTLFWYAASLTGVSLPYIYCLLFGALISPTDPIAVMAILKTVGVSKSLETKICGESLFNDGVGVVVFILIAGIATGQYEFAPTDVVLLFTEEVIGGVLFGLIIGYLCYLMLSKVDNYQVEILLTLALVSGGYALAATIHVSGPLAVVVAGLLIGNHGRLLAMGDKTREHLDSFWELLDEILNAVLFVLIGLEVLIISINHQTFALGMITIIIVLFARFISIGLPITVLKKLRDFSPHAIKILTWGGIRGGISVALALSLPETQEKSIIVTITYCVVVFSIIAQGLTIGRLVKWASKS